MLPHAVKTALDPVPLVLVDEGAFGLEYRSPFRDTAMTTRNREADCRHFAAHFLALAKRSRADTEKALLLVLAEWWLDLAKRAGRGAKDSLMIIGDLG
jgi:hypothetical protein